MRYCRLSLRREDVGCVWFICRNMELRYWLVGAWQREKQQNKLVEWIAFVDTVRIKSADLKNKVLF